MKINISKLVEEFPTGAPSLLELQSLRLLIDVLQPHAVELYITKTSNMHVTMLSDSELREKTIKDSKFMLNMINEELNLDVSEEWLEKYLPKYRKLLKQNTK